MKSVVALTYLNRVVYAKKEYIHYFHFKGVYLGHKVNTLRSSSRNDLFHVGSVYLLYLEVEDIKNNELYVKIIKNKQLEDFQMREE